MVSGHNGIRLESKNKEIWGTFQICKYETQVTNDSKKKSQEKIENTSRSV